MACKKPVSIFFFFQKKRECILFSQKFMFGVSKNHFLFIHIFLFSYLLQFNLQNFMSQNSCHVYLFVIERQQQLYILKIPKNYASQLGFNSRDLRSIFVWDVSRDILKNLRIPGFSFLYIKIYISLISTVNFIELYEEEILYFLRNFI